MSRWQRNLLRTSKRSLPTQVRWTPAMAGQRTLRCWVRQSGGSAFSGLSHGSLASIHKEWRVVFKEPVAPPVDAAVAAAAAAKAAREAASAARVGTIVRARLAFEDVSGLMRAESVDALLERVQYKPPGSAAASFIVSFTFEGEMYEVAYLEASLDACVAAAAPPALSLPPVVVVGAVYGRTLAVLARVARSATLLAAEPTKVCSAELQQLAEALAVPGGAKPFTHPGMDGLAQAGAHAMFAESQLQALEAGAAAGVTVAAAAAGIPVVPMAHSVVSPMCQALGLPVRGQTTGSGGLLTGGGSGGVPPGAAGSSSSSWWDLDHSAGGRPGGQVHPRRVCSIPK